MKNVEDIIAKAEADYGVTFDDVHVSDVSTSEEELEESSSDSGERHQKFNVTHLFGTQGVHQGVHQSVPIPADAPSSQHNFGHHNEILKSERPFLLKPTRETYMDGVYSTLQDNTSKEKVGGATRSLMEEINLETYTVTTQTNNQPKKSESIIYSSHKLPNQPKKEETFRFTNQDDYDDGDPDSSNQVRAVQRKISDLKHSFLESSERAFQRDPLPQDRSVASSSSKSKKSRDASSVATPMPTTSYDGNPVISPPFSLLSPPRRTNSSRASTRNNGRYSRSELRRKAPPTVVMSPPKRTSTAHQNTKGSYFDIQKEIDDLTSHFSVLHNQSAREPTSFTDPDKMFQNDLNIMGQKSAALVDALQESYIRTDQLQRDNRVLQEKIDNLGNFKAESGDDKCDGNNRVLARRKSQETLMRELEPRDDYVKRDYPSVPKTPGTMFATEFVEVMQLDVGEHAYLADLMDRQWRSTSDYRIP